MSDQDTSAVRQIRFVGVAEKSHLQATLQVTGIHPGNDQPVSAHTIKPTVARALFRTYLRRGRRCSSSVRIGTGCSGGSIKPSATPRSCSQFCSFSFMVPPWGSAERLEFCSRFLQIIVLSPTYCLNETTTNYY